MASLLEVPADRWSSPPSAGRWSAAEIVEHVALADLGIARWLTSGLEPLTVEPTVLDDEIPYLFYRGDEPPNVASPTGSWTDRDEAIGRLREAADAIVDWVRSSDVDLRRHGAPHPVFGSMDAAQWVLFAVAHTERHRAQLFALTNTAAR